jgi:hypothetical protein
MTARRSDDTIGKLADRIEAFLTDQPRFFVEVVSLTPEGQYRDVLQAWGVVRERCALERDEEGRYQIRPRGAGGRA